MNFFDFLGIFLVFYLLRYFLDSDYKETKKKQVVFDIIITSTLAFVIVFSIRFLWN